ncbi:hypothetical protein Tco_1292792 [Tanacetum coccineum]
MSETDESDEDTFVCKDDVHVPITERTRRTKTDAPGRSHGNYTLGQMTKGKTRNHIPEILGNLAQNSEKNRAFGRGYILHDTWDKCGEVCDETLESWFKYGFKEEEKRECSMDGIPYDPPKAMRGLPISRMNGARFKKEIRREMDTTRRVQRRA